MILYGPLETDARVQRSISAFMEKNYSMVLVSCQTDKTLVLDQRIKHINLSLSIGGFVSYVLFSLKCLFLFLQENRRFDVIYLQDYFSSLPGVLISNFTKSKIYYDAHELILKKRKDKFGFRDRFFIWLEKCLIRKSSVIIEANKERETIIRRFYHIRNTISVMNITNVLFKNITRDLPKDNIFLVYQGIVNKERNIDFFIRALLTLPETIKLIIIGDGPSLNEFKSLTDSLNLNCRIIFTGRLSNQLMMEKLSHCSIGLITYSFNTLNNVYCSPNKIFEYAAVSLPFISTNQPFIKEIQMKYHIGETFIPNNFESFSSAINNLLSDYHSYSNLKGFMDFLSDYSSEKELDKLRSII